MYRLTLADGTSETIAIEGGHALGMTDGEHRGRIPDGPDYIAFPEIFRQEAERKYARMQMFHQSAEQLDQLSATFREQFAATHGLTGFTTYQFLVDRDRGKAVLMSFWETREDLLRLERHNARAREQVRQDAGIESPTAEIFDPALSGP